MDISTLFYGSVTVGERGQIVIPAEARAELQIKPGDKLIVMRDPTHGCLSIGTLSRMRQVIDQYEAAYENLINAEPVKEELS
ncbi:MAG: AbrB/MazE/SpoVT family DNA-binding domain-containing protein [Armatimonadetes bacterium]|nr:AbrB/MazE/SpoVT family DNA-binding domain-containing protein [Armatimonadota bacterium]